MLAYRIGPMGLRGFMAATCLSLLVGCGAGEKAAVQTETPESPPSNPPSNPPTSAPSAPTAVNATGGDAQISLAWAASSGATSYKVKRSTTSGSGYTQLATPTATSYLDTTVSNGSTYHYVITAVNAQGDSADSAQASATPVSLPPAPNTPPAGVPAPTANLPSGASFNFTTAAPLSGITMLQNRDSVIIRVPAVANARDFRVLVQPTGVTANGNGTESVAGGTQFCAGVRQHQTRTKFVADNVSKYPYFFYLNSGWLNPSNPSPPNFFGDGPPTPWSWNDFDTPPHREIEITGVTGNMTVTVEAMDRLCPFPGTLGRQHLDLILTHGPDVDHPGNPWIDASSVTTFPIVTKSEVTAKYGSLIINGQGWAGGPNVQANPPAQLPFAQPAPVNPPIVLARAAITISPLAAPPAAPAGFFDDFSNSGDTFQSLPVPNWSYPRYPNGGQLVAQNSKWTMYGNGFTCCTQTAPMSNIGYVDGYVDNGALRTTLGDVAQDVFSEVTLIPRKAAHLNDSSYLHVTYEVNSYASNRRYWIFSLCGSNTAGQTMDSAGVVKEQIVHSTFFYNPTGMSPSTAGWNCLQILNRYGSSHALSQYESLYNVNGTKMPVPANNGLYDLKGYISNSIASIADPTKTAAYTVHPESDVVVLINKPIPKANLPEVGGTNEQVVQSAATSPINVSPAQFGEGNTPAWFYKVDNNGNPVAGVLDDQQLVSPRTKYDLYIRNNRIIMYANGKPALCNDFSTATTKLNIADAALGFHQVIYHSSAEFIERYLGPDQLAAYHYRYNSPWLDQRSWDNMGFEENVAAPSDFNPATCYVHKSRGPENNEP